MSNQCKTNIAYKERSRWLIFGLPFTFTVYTIKEDALAIKKGFLNTTEDDCYMYKIQDVKLKTSFWQKVFGIATIVCYTGDVTDKELELKNIKNAKEIKEYLMNASEKARMDRRVIQTNNIDADDVDVLEQV